MEKKIERSNDGVSNCRFCKPSLDQINPYSPLEHQRIDLINLFETEHLEVKPDILPTRPDGQHFLLIPKKHGLSFAALPHNLDNEAGFIIRRVEEEFGPVAFFEHGSTEEGKKIQSVYHQHAHIISTNNNQIDVIGYMTDRLKKIGISFDAIRADDYLPLINIRQRFLGLSYLYIQQGLRGLIAHELNSHDSFGEFPSQITQKSMSLFFNGEELNWKNMNEKERLAKESMQRMMMVVNRCIK